MGEIKTDYVKFKKPVLQTHPTKVSDTMNHWTDEHEDDRLITWVPNVSAGKILGIHITWEKNGPT